MSEPERVEWTDFDGDIGGGKSDEDSDATGDDDDDDKQMEHISKRRCMLDVNSPYEKHQRNLEVDEELFEHLDKFLSGEYQGDCDIDDTKQRLLMEYHCEFIPSRLSC